MPTTTTLSAGKRPLVLLNAVNYTVSVPCDNSFTITKNLLHNFLRFLIALQHHKTFGFQNPKLLAFRRQFYAFVHAEHDLKQTCNVISHVN